MSVLLIQLKPAPSSIYSRVSSAMSNRGLLPGKDAFLKQNQWPRQCNFFLCGPVPCQAQDDHSTEMTLGSVILGGGEKHSVLFPVKLLNFLLPSVWPLKDLSGPNPAGLLKEYFLKMKRNGFFKKSPFNHCRNPYICKDEKLPWKA